MLQKWYQRWYQTFYVGYQYRIGIEASGFRSISIVSVSKFQVLESISIPSISIEISDLGSISIVSVSEKLVSKGSAPLSRKRNFWAFGANKSQNPAYKRRA